MLVGSSIFYYSKKWIKETVLSIAYQIKLNAQGHLKCGGITDRKDVNDDDRLGRPSTSTTDETIKPLKQRRK